MARHEEVAPMSSSGASVVDVKLVRFPCCIVWSPLPPITWFLPMIGHMGICDSRGVIYDFAGPYTINENDMAFGNPTRYLQLDLASIDPAAVQPSGGSDGAEGDGGAGGGGSGGDGGAAVAWDRAVAAANVTYCQRMHNICCDNCHSHVANALTRMRYGNSTRWNMFVLCFWVFFAGKFTDRMAILKQFLPFTIIACAVLLFALLGK